MLHAFVLAASRHEKCRRRMQHTSLQDGSEVREAKEAKAEEARRGCDLATGPTPLAASKVGVSVTVRFYAVLGEVLGFA